MKSCDLLIHSSFCLPISPQNDLLRNQTIAITNGKIIEIGNTSNLKKNYAAAKTLDLSNHLVMPGLINCYIEPSELVGWEEDHSKQTIKSNDKDSTKNTRNISLDENEAELEAEKFLTKIIKSGTTTFAYMHHPSTQIATMSNKLGIRSQFAVRIRENLSQDNTQPGNLSRVLTLYDDHKHNSLVNIAFGIRDPSALSPSFSKEISMLANEIQIPIQAILDNELTSRQNSSSQIKQSWLNHFQALGLLGPYFQLIQKSQLSKEILGILSNSGSNVIHCPSSGMRKAEGYSSIETIKKAGISAGLGTHKTYTNQSLSIFHEANLASLFAKHEDREPLAGSLKDLIYTLTLGGAHVLGMDEITGSIEPGKQADLIAINIVNLKPSSMEALLSSLIYGHQSLEIEHVFISGKALLEKGNLAQNH